jgi:hypothetical protein
MCTERKGRTDLERITTIVIMVDFAHRRAAPQRNVGQTRVSTASRNENSASAQIQASH